MNTHPSDVDEERERLLRKVFSNVSHDLKTPLACIIGSLEIMERLQETLSAKDRKALIHTAITEAHKLENFISDMLSKAKSK
jgi:K+-sensing histidine kinase KdpD